MQEQELEPEEEKIELRSEEVQEILGTPPRWIVRWGTTLAFFVLVVLIFVSWLIKYPEILEAKLVLTTTIPPSPLVARADGNIEELFVEEKDVVPMGELLAVIQSTGLFADVLLLENELPKLQNLNETTILDYQVDRSFILGDLQPGYSKLIENFEAINRNQTTDFAEQSIGRLHAEMRAVKQGIASERSKLSDFGLDLANAKTDQERVKKLYARKIKARIDLERAQDKVSAIRRQQKQVLTNISFKEQELSRLDNEILNVENKKKSTTGTNFTQLRQDAQRLQSEIESWKQRYLIYSPVGGEVAFNGLIKENQFIKSGSTLLRIIPNEKEWIGRVELPTIGSGKVEIGQRVVIKFDNFPFQEHGIVEGVVRNKSLLPSGDLYNLEVNFPNNLTTSYGKTIPYKPEMQGRAEIIIDNKRFIGWVFDKLISRFRTY